MSDTIKQNNELRESQLLAGKASEMSKAEFISMNILSGLISNGSLSDLDTEELTNKAVELTRVLLKKVNIK